MGLVPQGWSWELQTDSWLTEDQWFARRRLHNFRRTSLVHVLRLCENRNIKGCTPIFSVSCIIHISDTFFSWQEFILKLAGFRFCIKNKWFTWKHGTNMKTPLMLASTFLMICVGDNGPRWWQFEMWTWWQPAIILKSKLWSAQHSYQHTQKKNVSQVDIWVL